LHDYTYDQRGRLTSVKDNSYAFGAGRTTRSCTFSLNLNRTRVDTAPAAANGTCSTASPATTTATFDGMDRMTDTGYTYDDRSRTLPADHTIKPRVPHTRVCPNRNAADHLLRAVYTRTRSPTIPRRTRDPTRRHPTPRAVTLGLAIVRWPTPKPRPASFMRLAK
jgi:hypothetical protein